MGKFEAFITVDYTGKNGRRYKRTKKANSFIRAFIDFIAAQMIYGCAAGTATYATPDTGNTARDTRIGSYPSFCPMAGAGVTTYGIVVGTGTNAVAVSNYALQTKIAHGVGSGQLSYGAQSSGVPYTSGSSRIFTLSRTFTNASGADITVNEVGIYVYQRFGSGGSDMTYFCIERSLESFTVVNGTSNTVTYSIKVTV